MRSTASIWLLLSACLASCSKEITPGSSPTGQAQPPSESAAIAVVRDRFTRHFATSQGFGVDTLRARSAWFTPCLYSLLLADMEGDSARGGVGYLDWDPFTAAQDDAAGFRIERAENSHDTVFVHLRIAYPGIGRSTPMTVATTQLTGEWRLANIITPDANLARGLDSSLRAEAAAGTRAFAGCTPK